MTDNIDREIVHHWQSMTVEQRIALVDELPPDELGVLEAALDAAEAER